MAIAKKDWTRETGRSDPQSMQCFRNLLAASYGRYKNHNNIKETRRYLLSELLHCTIINDRFHRKARGYPDAR